jgi:hypothetical protein
VAVLRLGGGGFSGISPKVCCHTRPCAGVQPECSSSCSLRASRVPMYQWRQSGLKTGGRGPGFPSLPITA